MFISFSSNGLILTSQRRQSTLATVSNLTATLAVGEVSTPRGRPVTAAPFQFGDECVFHPTINNYVMIVAFCTIFCLSVIGNSVVVVVILQQRSMRSVTNIYLLNLALSDLLLSVVCMPPTLVSSLVYCWVFGDVLCKALAYLQPVVVTASAYTLAAIALERYYAICKPLQSRVWHTKTHAMAMIALVWVIAIVSNVFMLFLYELQTYNQSGLNCAPKHKPIVHFAYQVYMTIVLLVVPLVIMTCLYGSVIRTLKSGIRMDIAAIEVQNGDGLDNNRNETSPTKGSNNNGVGNGPTAPSTPLQPTIKGILSSNGSAKSKRFRWTAASIHGANGNVSTDSRKTSSVLNGAQSLRSTHSGRTALVKQRLVRMLIVVVIIFFCCWTPSYIWWLLLNAQDAFGLQGLNVWNSELNTFITVLTYLSSCTNPITYCFLNSKFRNALFLSFGCKSKSGLRSHFSRLYAPANTSTVDTYHEPSLMNQSIRSVKAPGAGRNRFKTMPLRFEVLQRLKSAMSTDSPSLHRQLEARLLQMDSKDGANGQPIRVPKRESFC
uniref:G_PROTEIN_RECEP_F1_2 domain-containing protein n=1 Tax=Bursaphelenchus xylophilus TaxID=6326 RepID=A0A1I7RZJ9_BURXY